jgi:hypothetical protein
MEHVSVERLDKLKIERPSFSCDAPEKLGLFTAFRWRCSSRGETEFFSRTYQLKTGLFLVSTGNKKDKQDAWYAPCKI